ncbi:MAG: hypothetical protein ACTSVP_06570 [Candidatus Heimdallarchaeota archaeon]
MTEDIKCEVCEETATPGDVYCNKCGNILSKENWDNRIKHERLRQDLPTEFTEIQQEKGREKKKWYKPPKRKRPAYYPIEWFFWIGWGFYVFFGFIFLALKWVMKEILKYVLWCCYWGPPSEMRKDK